MEVTIIATGGNSAGSAMWDNSHSFLIDNAGIEGHPVREDGSCAVSVRGSAERPFLSMKLDAPRKILSMQIAFRTRGSWQDQGKNVRVQVQTGFTIIFSELNHNHKSRLKM